ncbi:AAA domain-containing protein [Ureaplasma canigenitalium]|uniref:AAA domain-containing protein n=1 Tax=Ureaplasma canigenitalium TaxID=42092 RepID=UPI0004E1AF79|nr:AAA domain-containing protein [Ureaplasma canigenitalium]
MKKAIKQKLMNLVSLNPNDSVILTRLSQTKHIDLFKYVDKQDLLDFVYNETGILELSTNQDVNLFEEELKKADDSYQFINVCTSYGINLNEFRINLLNKNFKDNKKKVIQYAIEQLLLFRKKFIAINRLAKTYYDDTTVWPLYLAFNFIKGKVLANEAFKSPLTLFKVEIREEANRLYLAKIQDESVVNEKLQIFLKKMYQEIKIDATELLSTSDINKVINNIENTVGYEIALPTDELVPFNNESEQDILNRYTNFEIEPSSILGVFEPDGGALKEDLHKIIEQDIDPFETESKNGINKPVSFYEDKVIKEQMVIEIGHPLNIYQKYAVASSLNQNTLIYGPPGTGKSEVIANIIFNTLLKSKTCLLVSEKRAALDVLTERIGSLSQFALYVYDTSNKENFYNKIANLNDLLGTQWYRETIKGGSKKNELETIKFTPEESMYLKNYSDWNNELVELVEKHWKIEGYQDGIYKMDYALYNRVKTSLGEQIINEWLTPKQFFEGQDKHSTLFEEITTIFNEYTLLKIEDLFQAYINYTTFIRKFKLNDTYSNAEILKHLRVITNKINVHNDIVTRFLMNEKEVTRAINNYNEFLLVNNLGESETFNKKTLKEKKIFIEKIGNYLKFRKEVIEKDFTLSSKTPEELIEISLMCEIFFNKHRKLLVKNEWYEFIRRNKEKIIAFLPIYDVQNTENKQILFAEFILKRNIITAHDPSDECTLSLKEIRQANKEATEIVELFRDYIENINYLSKPRMDELFLYKEFLDQDINFLSKLYTLENIFTPNMQEIIREWSWLSLPYLRKLYLEPLILFDLEKVLPIMSQVSTFINNEQFKQLKMIVLWESIIQAVPTFNETKGRLLQDIVSQLRKESMRSASVVGEITFRRYINNLRSYLTKLPQADKEEITNALRIASSKTWPSVSRYVSKYYNALKKLFPIWVARPDNVASLIPLKENEFDYGIFDEASQMTIERSYPVVYRCNIKVVSGDDKQLKPTSFFVNKLDEADYELDDFNKVDSLLERAKTSWWNEFHLRNHYRSNTKELIEFSNKYIYDNKLELATRQGCFDKGIEVINVNGIWDKGNPIEAETTVATIIDHWKYYDKILVVTFNAVQATLVENLLLEQLHMYEKGLVEKIDRNEIIITNLENVQGNEGDLVILSVAYGPNPTGVIRNNFGPLNAKGGANRLNVAITRARAKLIVIKSLYGHQIQVSNHNNTNAITFKKFIEYIDEINESSSLSETLKGFDEQTQLEFDNDLVKEIYSELTKKLSNKYQVFPNWNIGTKKIDLAILKKDTKEVVKTILLETWKANDSIKVMYEDIDRQYFLEDRGYSTYRIKEYEWYIDKHKIIARINDSLTNANKKDKIDYVLWQKTQDSLNN